MKRVVETLEKIQEGILIIAVVIMGGVLFLQIIMRFIFHSPLEWPEELARYLQVFITFLGIGYGIKNSSHVRMTLLTDRLPKKINAVLECLTSALGIFCFFVLLKVSIVFLEHQNVLSTALQIPMFIVYSIIPVSAVICMLYFASNIIHNILLIIHKENKLC